MLHTHTHTKTTYSTNSIYELCDEKLLFFMVYCYISHFMAFIRFGGSLWSPSFQFHVFCSFRMIHIPQFSLHKTKYSWQALFADCNIKYIGYGKSTNPFRSLLLWLMDMNSYIVNSQEFVRILYRVLIVEQDTHKKNAVSKSFDTNTRNIRI